MTKELMKISKKLYDKMEHHLIQYNGYKIQLQNWKLDLEEAKENYRGISGIEYSDKIRGKNNGPANLVESEIEFKEKRIEDLQQQIKRLERLLEKIENSFNILQELEKKIIDLYYFKNNQWYEVAASVDFSEKTCRNKRKQAIYKLAGVMFEEKTMLNVI